MSHFQYSAQFIVNKLSYRTTSKIYNQEVSLLFWFESLSLNADQNDRVIHVFRLQCKNIKILNSQKYTGLSTWVFSLLCLRGKKALHRYEWGLKAYKI